MTARIAATMAALDSTAAGWWLLALAVVAVLLVGPDVRARMGAAMRRGPE